MLNLFLGLCVMLACLLMQALLLVVVIRFYFKRRHLLDHSGFLSSLSIVSCILLLLVLGVLVQIGIWASLFVFLGEFQAFSLSYYHSAVNFSTLGYGDVVMSDKHKLLGPLEAVNGVLMIGVSTSVLMLAFQDIIHIAMSHKDNNKPSSRG